MREGEEAARDRIARHPRAVPAIVAGGVVIVMCVAMTEIALRFVPVAVDQDSTVFEQSLPGLRKQVLFQKNALGFRSRSMSTKEKPPDVFRIVCLGASTTEQVPQSIEDTWCGILEKELEEVFALQPIRIETAAYGRGGLKAADLFWWARHELLEFEPDLVITMLGINDLTFNGGPDYSYAGLAIKRPSLKDRCKQTSQLCLRLALLKLRVRRWLESDDGRILEWHSSSLPGLRRRYLEYPYVAVPERSPDPIEEFSDAVAALLSYLAEVEIEAVVLGQPVLWKQNMTAAETDMLWFYVNTPDGPVRPSGSWLVGEMGRYNDIQGDHAGRFGASYVDLDRLVPKDRRHYFDDCHYTDLGSQRVAYAVLPAVTERVHTILSRRSQRAVR